jgi:hypothetical protein
MKKLYFNVGFAILDEKPGGENEEGTKDKAGYWYLSPKRSRGSHDFGRGERYATNTNISVSRLNNTLIPFYSDIIICYSTL